MTAMVMPAPRAGQNNCARAGATVDGYRFSGFRQADGKTVGDLNDFVNIDYDQWAVESIFAFVPKTPKECSKRCHRLNAKQCPNEAFS
jgi:hypothetical protein